MKLGSEQVTVLRASRSDDHGSEISDWSGEPTPTVVQGCSVQPGVSAEDRTHREADLVAFTVFMPTADVDVTSSDRLRFRGHDHPVLGMPEQWVDEDPNVAHTKVLVASWRDLEG
jgi:hypothetical protein